MTFTETFRDVPALLTEGGVVERIRRDHGRHLDPHIAHAGMVLDAEGRDILRGLYREYIGIGVEARLPFLTLAPTWRANPERIARSAFRDTAHLNRECIRFMSTIRDSFGSAGKRVFIGGLMACRHDAYRPDEALTEEEAVRFHAVQARELADAGPDFIKAATLPAVSEAAGLARAVAAQGLPYILSFVIRAEGTLLDGCPIHEAIDRIDAQDHPAPLGYMVNCVHPGVFERAMTAETGRSDRMLDRLAGLQANTSRRTPEELDDLEFLDTTDPEPFAEEMVALHTRHGLKILGGCCGSNGAHIREIARRLGTG